jgi:hypothetical protein
MAAVHDVNDIFTAPDSFSALGAFASAVPTPVSDIAIAPDIPSDIAFASDPPSTVITPTVMALTADDLLMTPNADFLPSPLSPYTLGYDLDSIEAAYNNRHLTRGKDTVALIQGRVNGRYLPEIIQTFLKVITALSINCPSWCIGGWLGASRQCEIFRD